MKLSEVVSQYVTFKQSMGMRFRTQAKILKYFSRALGDISITEVDPDSVRTFISGKGPVTTYWHHKFSVLNGFYRFAISRGFIDFCPLPTAIPKRPEPLEPYIYTQDELRRLLATTDTLKSSSSPLQPATFRTLLLTLYGTCFRISEALSLTLADVDLSNSLITVRESKFYKSRLVPIGPRLTEVLGSYAGKRKKLPQPAGQDAAFFCRRTGNAVSYKWASKIFQRLRTRAGVLREQEARYQPRMHDIRHTSAVHRLVAWYREGADVQHLLPQLSTFMGHEDISGTQHYLSMIPELLEEASRRFERYALSSEVNHEKD
jgi:site-specific recombinase XerD